MVPTHTPSATVARRRERRLTQFAFLGHEARDLERQRPLMMVEVLREPHPNDARAVRVSLTADSEETMCQLGALHRDCRYSSISRRSAAGRCNNAPRDEAHCLPRVVSPGRGSCTRSGSRAKLPRRRSRCLPPSRRGGRRRPSV